MLVVIIMVMGYEASNKGNTRTETLIANRAGARVLPAQRRIFVCEMLSRLLAALRGVFLVLLRLLTKVLLQISSLFRRKGGTKLQPQGHAQTGRSAVTEESLAHSQSDTTSSPISGMSHLSVSTAGSPQSGGPPKSTTASSGVMALASGSASGSSPPSASPSGQFPFASQPASPTITSLSSPAHSAPATAGARDSVHTTTLTAATEQLIATISTLPSTVLGVYPALELLKQYRTRISELEPSEQLASTTNVFRIADSITNACGFDGLALLARTAESPLQATLVKYLIDREIAMGLLEPYQKDILNATIEMKLANQSTSNGGLLANVQTQRDLIKLIAGLTREELKHDVNWLKEAQTAIKAADTQEGGQGVTSLASPSAEITSEERAQLRLLRSLLRLGEKPRTTKNARLRLVAKRLKKLSPALQQCELLPQVNASDLPALQVTSGKRASRLRKRRRKPRVQLSARMSEPDEETVAVTEAAEANLANEADPTKQDAESHDDQESVVVDSLLTIRQTQRDYLDQCAKALSYLSHSHHEEVDAVVKKYLDQSVHLRHAEDADYEDVSQNGEPLGPLSEAIQAWASCLARQELDDVLSQIESNIKSSADDRMQSILNEYQ